LRDTLTPSGAPVTEIAGWRAQTVEALGELAELDVRAAGTIAPHAREIAARPAYEPDALQV
jgi:hypothetical protein